jgi:hypothetical protein
MSKTSKHPQFTAYIPQRVLDALKKEAERQHRSMNGQLVWCLERGLGLEKGDNDATGRKTHDQQI